MMKLVTIIIPQHYEKESVIKRLLLSINMQIGINKSDIAIKIIGDGGYRLSDRFLKQFKNLDIDYTYYDESVGSKRYIEIGTNISDSHYISYMNANDEFNTVNSLWKFKNAIINNGDHELIFSRYVEEKSLKNYHIHEYNSLSYYGKIINLTYINNFKKYFYMLMKDSYNLNLFMDLITFFSEDIYYLNSPTYTHLIDNKLNSRLDFTDSIIKRDINLAFVRMYKFIHSDYRNMMKHKIVEYLYKNKKIIDLDISQKYISSLYPSLDNKSYKRFFNNTLRKVNNKKLLSIIIPFYGDNIEKIYPLLNSIEYQVGINLNEIEILIVKDGGEKISYELSKVFSQLNIKLFHSKYNLGPGPARNIGINFSNGKFIMFCDSDDNLSKPTSLFLMKQAALNNTHAQVIMSRYNNEQLNDNGLPYLATWDYNYGATYPNWYNLRYLNSNNLRFHPNLHSYYEDTYFVGLACNIASNIEFVNNVVYTHRYNKNSLIHLPDKRKLYSRFLIEYCRENYYWFKAIKVHLPLNLVADINNFIVSIYKMYKEYNLNSKTVDDKMIIFTKKITLDNSEYWNVFNEKLQSKIDKASIDNKDFKKFVDKFM